MPQQKQSAGRVKVNRRDPKRVPLDPDPEVAARSSLFQLIAKYPSSQMPNDDPGLADLDSTLRYKVSLSLLTLLGQVLLKSGATNCDSCMAAYVKEWDSIERHCDQAVDIIFAGALTYAFAREAHVLKTTGQSDAAIRGLKAKHDEKISTLQRHGDPEVRKNRDNTIRETYSLLKNSHPDMTITEAARWLEPHFDISANSIRAILSKKG